MVRIRLSRFGKKNSPTFRIVVSDGRKDVHGTYIEAIGRYNPSVQPHEVEVDKERAQYWLSQGAQASTSVHNILVEQGVIDAQKKKASKIIKPEPVVEEPTEVAEETSGDDAPAEEQPAEAAEAPAEEPVAEEEEKKEEAA